MMMRQQLWDCLGGWSGYGLRLGTEYNVETIVEMKNSLTSFYLNYEISDCFSAFVRQDTEDEDVDTDASSCAFGVTRSTTGGTSCAVNKSIVWLCR